MIMKILARNKEKNTAFAYEIKSYKPAMQQKGVYFCTDNPVYCTDMNNSCWYADKSEIVTDPEIIKKACGNMYLIKLEG